MRVVRRCVLAVIGVVTMTLLAVPAVTAQQQQDEIEHYVALGDSFTAGPFIPLQRADPVGCARSTRNYPSMVATGLGVEQFTDVSCSAAVTEDMTEPQTVPLGVNPPQFDALRPDTDLVTVGIVGNDIGFGDIVTTCAQLSVTDPQGDPCREQATAGGGDEYAARIDAAAPELAGVLQGITERSPDATVVLVGYLRILPPTTGCFPLVPIARGDVPYLDGIQRQLTEMMAEQADAHGALFTDPYANSLGRDVCAGPFTRWVEGFIPNRPAFPVHPNASGMQAVSDLVLGTLSETPA
ncbi:MAG: SGNH/GDSL hydrolase family protein [Pseudonocardiaceae bacterium]|nr:SGNH/GDSL hydrolase family protein [Pseudonocardiaceae bacterium]